jgi:hypothetical protein
MIGWRVFKGLELRGFGVWDLGFKVYDRVEDVSGFRT